MKYRKKPLIIEAFRIGIDNIPDWAMDKVTSNEITLLSPTAGKHGPFEHMNDTYCTIKTLEGTMTGDYGDYIILEPFPTSDRTCYPCKPSIFESTYELVKG